ncbi:hypothetical protein [Streptomyces sp. NBC_00887]|uniref:hypothetical protein n=1 Tax=Streptomyces sp. NBC_00887 TaxID=2975859 RepID=UPI003869E5FE|nr:hypothetical protein OG844_02135 [Streptomyces sp. NBC_00887]WSY36069.1 hypothetical protein OG844_43465 [Streptomyces sp. NBC_00887]
MNMPIGPVILFDDDYSMYVLEDRASAEAWWEMPDDYSCGFDALARPLRMTGEPHQVSLELNGDEPAEAELRRLVANHYQRFSHGQVPPRSCDLSEFVAGLPVEGS